MSNEDIITSLRLLMPWEPNQDDYAGFQDNLYAANKEIRRAQLGIEQLIYALENDINE